MMSVAALPKMIRVGYLDYTVEEWKPSEAHAAGRFGECDRHHLVIRVRADMPAHRKAETLIHETLHAAFDAGEICDSDHEERTVAILGKQLAQIWRDNPGFVAFIEAVFRPQPIAPKRSAMGRTLRKAR